ncbi:MAG: hypothetical protein M3069_29865, partial [Chloroflexota bacterium]|nr:hypothetical protein [Chloroflexota bacterium]
RTRDSPRPTPLRTDIDRSTDAAGSATSPTPGDTPGALPATPARHADTAAAAAPRLEHAEPAGLLGRPMLGRFSAVPVPLRAAGVAAVVGLAVLAYLIAPHLGSLFVDDSVDLSGLPNASAVAAGTSVAQVAARRTAVPVVVPSQVAGPGAASAPVAATPVPEVAAASTAVPTAALSHTTPPQTAASASPGLAAPAQAGGNTLPPAAVTLFDEKFADNARNWPSDAQGTAWLSGGSYRLIPRQAGQFVAVGAPVAAVPPDVSVSATFRKLDGTPAGGGFGIILRDQGTSPRDGTSQSGQYYVLEVGDKAEVGIWRRDTDHWVDLVPWQHADAVHPGISTNEMTVTAVGSRLSLSVNGTQVVTRTDATLPTGGVGMMVGGDGNQIAVDHFFVQTP